MEQNKTRSYLLYALGEILLVMIGILLALQINNWNEERKNEAQFISILKELQADIVTDVRTINQLQPHGIKVDSVAKKILAGEVSREEYENPKQFNLFWAGMQYFQFSQQTNAFQKLKEFNGEIDEEYQELMMVINDLYINTSEHLNRRQQIFIDTIEDRHDYLSKNYDWYHLLRNRSFDDDMLDYYLNDPEYKNFLSRYYSDQLFAPYSEVVDYENRATVLYFRINEVLNQTTVAEVFSEVEASRLNADFNRLIGRYQNLNPPNNQILITKKAGIPTMSGSSSSLNIGQIIIERDAKYLFLSNPKSKLVFETDSLDRITTLKSYRNEQDSVFFKKLN